VTLAKLFSKIKEMVQGDVW